VKLKTLVLLNTVSQPTDLGFRVRVRVGADLHLERVHTCLALALVCCHVGMLTVVVELNQLSHVFRKRSLKKLNKSP